MYFEKIPTYISETAATTTQAAPAWSPGPSARYLSEYAAKIYRTEKNKKYSVPRNPSITRR
jgi:hypothetical protein